MDILRLDMNGDVVDLACHLVHHPSRSCMDNMLQLQMTMVAKTGLIAKHTALSCNTLHLCQQIYN